MVIAGMLVLAGVGAWCAWEVRQLRKSLEAREERSTLPTATSVKRVRRRS